jgi:hypothetical protein
MLDAHRTCVLAGATGQALEEIFLRNENLAMCFLGGSPSNDISAAEKAFLRVKDDFLGTERSSNQVSRTELGAAATLDAGIEVENVLSAKVLEVDNSQVVAFFP